MVMQVPFLAPFTESEIATAIAACPRGKASGPDGLPNDWYRDHAERLTPLLTRLFNQWYAAGVLPPSFSGATIFCIPKKPAPQTGLDYRPIALLNTDYKIFSRVLLNRVTTQLESIVSPTQFGFVPNRQVHDALDVWTAITQLVAEGAGPAKATAVLLDFAKAYDTLDRRFLSLALRRVGFPNTLIRAIEVMHLATTAAYLTEDRLSDNHAILNGIRQGCPFAPVLFILAVDTLYDQLAAATDLEGVELPSGTRITAAGFADDTTVYLSDPQGTGPLRRELDRFAAASGLSVNVDKCMAVALARTGWATDVGDIGFPKLPVGQMVRALGSQVASALNVDLVWELTVKQLRTRLVLAQTKTTDVLQRAQVAQAIITPKLMYVGRHTWPSATRIRSLQKLVNNYVWHGRFDPDCSGRAGMSHDSATLARKDGGIALPDLASEFIQLSVSTHLRWGERATGLRGEIGRLLSGGHSTAAMAPRPVRTGVISPSVRGSLAATGGAVVASMVTQPRTGAECEKSTELLKLVGRGTVQTRRWEGDWFVADYAAVQPQLLQLRNWQTAAHGGFSFHGLMAARIVGDGVLLGASGREVRLSDFSGLVRTGTLVGEVLDIQYDAPGRARFRCRTVPFPLPPQAARSFRRLCDTVVFNYPAVLAPHDPVDVVRVEPATIDSWRLADRQGSGFDLIWEPTAGIHINLGEVHTMRAVTAKVRKTMDEPTARALDHAWLSPLRAIWHTREPLLTKNNAKRFIRAAKKVRGQRENAARERKLTAANEIIGHAQANRSWQAIDRLNATTSRQRLKLRQLKGNRISGWDRLHEQHGCPHCPEARDGGSIPHIFWECPAAQALWKLFLAACARLEVWPTGSAEGSQQQRAIFDLQLPRFPGRLWRLPDLHSIPLACTEDVACMHDTAQVAWQQQVLVTKEVIWKWRHNIDDSAQQWSKATATTYLSSALRSSTCGLLDRLPRDRRLRDPRRQLLRALASALDDLVDPPAACSAQTPPPSSTQPKPPRSVLFFDGGSRGNPGPGGAGAVLVGMEADTTHPRVIWSASLSFKQLDMTNNQAEYLGAVAGLREALKRGLRPEVVGDSALVLRQLRCYQPPKSSKLRPLYSEARRLADAVQVDVWQHHLRAYNKMADAAANAAMDSRSSVQVSHPSDRPHTAGIDEHLTSDIHEWHTRHLLRSAQD